VIKFHGVMKVEGFENFKTMFAQSIGIVEPWYVRKAEFDDKLKEVHIYVGLHAGAKLVCAKCGKEGKEYDLEEEERIWRHGDCVFYPTYVHCRRPRIRCEKDGVHVVNVPWARERSRFTLLFEGYAVLVMTNTPINQAKKELRCGYKALVQILRYWVKKSVDKEVLKDVKVLSIDETSFKRGQSYVTIVLDGEARRVIDVEEGRNIETVRRFSMKLEEKGGDCNAIKHVASDMARAYKTGVEECFPKAKWTVDKFHIKQLLIEALDKVRIQEQKENKSKELNISRKLLMIPENRMNEQQQARLAQISKSYPKTGRAYRIVAALDIFYGSANVADARMRLGQLISWMKRCRLEPMKDAAKTLDAHKENIINYFISGLTSAISEGINSIIQAAKRKARGYNTYAGYETMIYLVAGKLELSCSVPY
jgi:transposase